MLATLPSRVLSVCWMEFSCSVFSDCWDSSDVRRWSKISRISEMTVASVPDRVGKVEEFLGEQASAQFLLDLRMLVQRAHEFFGGVGRRHGLPHW